MAVTESFLVNTNSFNPIIEALIERDEVPDEITDELFASMGFDSPSELLVIHMLKELNMLTVEGKPTELYHELTNPDTTDEALATGILHAYTDLFKQNPDFYKLQKDDVYKALEDHFEGRKTELILKYMTNTFYKLVSYAGLNNMQKAIDEHLKHEEEDVEVNGEVDSENVAEPENEEAVTEASSEEMEDSEEVHDMEDAGSEEEIPDSQQADEDEAEENEVGEIVAEEDHADVEESEADEDFDAIFFNEEEDVDEEDGPATDQKKGTINFDELPKVQREEKGSESIDEFLNANAAEDSDTEEVEEETADAESEVSAEAKTEDISSTEEEETDTEIEEKETTDQEESESLSDKQKETLEKELMEIDMESTNGLHKNGADNAEKPMTNLSNVPTKEKVEKAIIKKAELLYKLERFEDVLPAYKDVISYFDNSDKDHLQEAVAKAVINRVSVLKKLNKDEDELLPALEEVISRFEDSSVNEYYEHASLAMLDKAQLLEDAPAEDLLPLFNDIIDRLRNASTPKVKTQVDEIFVKKVDILTETGPEQKLLDAVDALIDRFEGSQTHTGQLEQAMYKKAEVLENLGRDEEALEAYSEFLDRFGQTKEMV